MKKPERKHPRLKNYDYSLPGYYYITIHASDPTIRFSSVGRGLALAGTQIHLTPLGWILQQQLLALEQRYTHVKIDKYVIMPTHIHLILYLSGITDAPSARASVTDIICAYKSLATRISNQHFQTPGRKIFQTSFYESVLRNEKAYQECWRYMEGNPAKWLEHEA